MPLLSCHYYLICFCVHLITPGPVSACLTCPFDFLPVYWTWIHACILLDLFANVGLLLRFKPVPASLSHKPLYLYLCNKSTILLHAGDNTEKQETYNSIDSFCGLHFKWKTDWISVGQKCNVMKGYLLEDWWCSSPSIVLEESMPRRLFWRLMLAQHLTKVLLLVSFVGVMACWRLFGP